MTDGEEWVMRPVLRGMCKYESLIRCEVDLEDIARMNAAIDVEIENENRRQKANET
jgi:hypothetical protein